MNLEEIFGTHVPVSGKEPSPEQKAKFLAWYKSRTNPELEEREWAELLRSNDRLTWDEILSDIPT